MATSNVEILVAKNAKDPNLVQVTAWDGTVRNLDLATWEEGDEFTITGDEPIWSQKLGKRRDGTDIVVQFIVVPVSNPKSDTVVGKNFYPTGLTKSVFEYNRSTKLRGLRKSVTGSAVEFAKTCVTNADLMAGLKGKKIRVPKIDSVFTLRYGQDASKDESYYEAQLPQYDLE